MRDRFIEGFRVKSLAPESPQIIGSEPAGRPQNPQRLIIGLVLIRLLASVQALASVRQIYQGNSHMPHPKSSSRSKKRLRLAIALPEALFTMSYGLLSYAF